MKIFARITQHILVIATVIFAAAGIVITTNIKNAEAGYADEASIVLYLGMMVHLNGWKVTDKVFNQFGWELF